MLVYPNVSLSGIGQSAAICPFVTQATLIGQLVGQPIESLGLVCTISLGASLTYSVQISGDNPNAIVNWINHNILFNLTQSEYSQIQFPVSAIRLVCTAYASGSVNLGTVQWP